MPTPNQLGDCPRCHMRSVEATGWVGHDGDYEGVAHCEAPGCGWSSIGSAHHQTRAERVEAEALAASRWYAETEANPNACPV